MPTVVFSPPSASIATFGFCAKAQVFSIANQTSAAVDITVSGTDLTMSPATQHIPPGQTKTVTVSYRPTTKGATTGQLSANSTPVATASISCTPNNPLYVDSTLEFGQVVVGQQARGLVSLRNRADIDAMLTAAVAPFDVPGAYGTIPAGAMAGVPTTFLPTAVNTFSTTLTYSVGPWSLTCTVTGDGITTPVTPPVTPPVLTPSVTPPTTPTSYQTFYLNVPSPNDNSSSPHGTTFNLGRAHDLGSGGEAGVRIDGFGVDTDLGGYLNSRGSAGIGIQAVANVAIQSRTGNVNITANKDGSGNNGDVVTAAGNSNYVLGNCGVLVATLGDDPTGRDKSTYMPDQTGITKAKKDANIVAAVFSAFDAFVGVTAAGYGLFLTKKTAGDLTRKKWTWWMSKGVPLLGAAAGFAVSITGSVSAGLSADGGSIAGPGTPGVTIYGHAGILMGTPGFSSFYAGAGMVLASSFPFMVGFDTTIMALHELSLHAAMGDASLFSNKETAVFGEQGVVVETGVAGSIELTAGNAALANTYTQIALKAAAGEIEAKAPKKFGLKVGVTPLATNIGMEPKKITIDAGATGTIVLKAGSWQIEIAATGITLSKGGTEPKMSLTAAGIEQAVAPDTSLKLAAAGATLKKGATQVVMTPGMGSYSGPKLNFGP